MRHSTKYLYDVEPEIFDDMLYPDALASMIQHADKLIAKLTVKSKKYTYGTYRYDEIYDRYESVIKAKKHNQDLLAHREIKTGIGEGS